MKLLKLDFFKVCEKLFNCNEKILGCIFRPLWGCQSESLVRRSERQVLFSPFLGNFDFNVSNFFSVPGTSKHKEYRGKKLVGFSMEQMFDVAADVENYQRFVPFCKKSVVRTKSETELWGKLVIGFPPIIESYTSHVILQRPSLVKADCHDGKLFKHLTSMWKFSPGLQKQPQSCVVDFYVSFEFKSVVHSQLAQMFFTELVRQMESAFITEAKRRYGKPAVKTVSLRVS